MQTSNNPAGGPGLVLGLEGIVCVDNFLPAAGQAVKLREEALKYAAGGWRVFPCGTDKTPRVKDWPKAASTDPAQVREWWTQWPGASIGCPMGAGRGAWVLDIDLPDGPASLTALEAEHGPLPATVEQRTGGGGRQLFFKWAEGREVRNSASKLAPGLDVRGEGGYCILPPSGHPSGGAYTWTSHGAALAEAPEWLLDLVAPQPETRTLHTSRRTRVEGTSAYGRTALEAEAANVTHTAQGGRNQALNEAAFALGQLVAGGELDRHETADTLLEAAQAAGLPESEARKTIASGMAAGEREPRNPDNVITVNKGAFSSTPSTSSTASTNVNTSSTVGPRSSTPPMVDISALVDEFIEQATGAFTSSELCQWCGLSTRDQRVAVSQALLRRIHKSKIERVGTRHGNFRRVESECALIDFLSCNEPPVEIALPFGLHKLVELMPGNITVVAGEPNAGKTAFMLNVVRENMHKAKVHYFNSEMGAQELQKRLIKFDIPLTDWTFHAWERTDNFQDAIVPGSGVINIIDFLEVSEDFYRVGGMLKAIHGKLNGALAIVALQKNQGTNLGLGGGRSLEKARLYLALEPGVAKIVKAKNWRTKANPNGLQIKFKTVDGCKLLAQGDWYKT